MQPMIVDADEKKFAGMRMKMNLANNRTGQLWGSFMQRRKEITNNLTSDLFSLQVYEPGYFEDFDPNREFEKWALAEIPDFNNVPAGMESFTCPAGTYAVFIYKGSSRDAGIFKYIFSTWLPSSGYVLDERPHFEILGAKYKNDDPDSEEEIWIPVRPKKMA